MTKFWSWDAKRKGVCNFWEVLFYSFLYFCDRNMNVMAGAWAVILCHEVETA